MNLTPLLIFVCTYVVVLSLGLQSLNVNRGHTVLAFVTSVVIALCNLMLLKIVPRPTGLAEDAAYVFGGLFGIVTSMWLHPRLVKWLNLKGSG